MTIRNLWPLFGGAFLLALLSGCSREPPVSPGNLGVYGLNTLQVSQVQEAASGWNQGIGRQYFALSDHPSVSIHFAASHGPGCYQDTGYTRAVWIDPEQQPSEILACLYHELGHVIGLDHSESTASIMYPWLDSVARPRPTDTDFLAARDKLK